jgi:hypothetical protein
MIFSKQLVYDAYELKMSFQTMDLKFFEMKKYDSFKYNYKNISFSNF